MNINSLFIFSSSYSSSCPHSEKANEALPLLDLLLDFVAGSGDLGLRREDSADKGEHGAAHGRVEGPAHGAEARPVGGGVLAAVQLDLV